MWLFGLLMNLNSGPPQPNHPDRVSSRRDEVYISRSQKQLVIDQDQNQRKILGNRTMLIACVIVLPILGGLLNLNPFGALFFGITASSMGFLNLKLSMDRNQIDRICLVRNHGFEVRYQGVLFTHKSQWVGELSTISSVTVKCEREGGGRNPRVDVWKVLIHADRTYTIKWGLDQQTCYDLKREIESWLVSAV